MRESAALAQVATLPRRSTWTDEHFLYAAIVRQAVIDMQSPSGRIREDAELWLASSSNELHSFGWCCTVLGLEPSAIRRAVAMGKPHVWRCVV